MFDGFDGGLKGGGLGRLQITDLTWEMDLHVTGSKIYLPQVCSALGSCASSYVCICTAQRIPDITIDSTGLD